MNKPMLLVLDDYEGELAKAPAVARLCQLAQVTILDHPLARSDVVSVHLRLSTESKHTLRAEHFQKMKPTAILINTARGELIDEAALVRALQAGEIAGAGLDVFAVEPLPDASPLRTLPNVLLTPHVGWQVQDVLHEFMDSAAAQLELWLKGTLSPAELLNPEVLLADGEPSAVPIKRGVQGVVNS